MSCFLVILLPTIPRPEEFTLDRDRRDEEIDPGERVSDVVPRLGVTLLYCRVVICGARMLGRGAGREDMLGWAGGDTRREPAPELDRLLLLPCDDVGGDELFLLLLACDLGAATTTAPMKIRSANI